MAGKGDMDFDDLFSPDLINSIVNGSGDGTSDSIAGSFATNPNSLLCSSSSDATGYDECLRKNMPISSALWFKVLSASLYGSIALLALMGNLIFCYVIWRSQKLHTVTHMLMTNLGICNLLFLLFHPAFFMNTYIFQTSWNLGE